MPDTTTLPRGGPAPAALSSAPPGVEPWALPIPQASAVSGLSRATFYREAARGRIVFLKVGRSTLVDMASVRAFMDALPRATIRQAPSDRARDAAAAAAAAAADADTQN